MEDELEVEECCFKTEREREKKLLNINDKQKKEYSVKNVDRT